MMMSDRYRGIGLQVLIVGAGILFFFAVIGGVVHWVMPGGKQILPVAPNPDVNRVKSKSSSVKPKEESGTFVQRAAVLSYLNNDVKSKRANEIIWQSATLNMPLYERDAVQTLKQSSAVITFDNKNFLDVNQNSLVIIKNFEENKVQQQKQSFLVLQQGNLRGQLQENRKGGVRLLVNTPSATTEVTSDQQSGKKSLFEIAVKPDRTSTIKVIRGSAKVRAQGKEVNVKAHQMTQVAVNQPPKTATLMPKAVLLEAPVQGAHFTYSGSPPRINFSWTAEPSAVKYHLQIAEDEQFRKVIFENQVSNNVFLYGSLNQGQYYWRVRAVDPRGEDGEPSEIRRIEVAQNMKSPKKFQDTNSSTYVKTCIGISCTTGGK